MTTIQKLVDSWREDSERLRRYADDRGARVCQLHADELEAALRAEQDELLSLDQAADQSGYSADHLGRMIRAGKLTNRGKKGAPLLRRGDLPEKPSGGPEGRAPGNTEEYDTDRLFRDIINSKTKER